MATHSSILSERTPWTEEPGRLQSLGSQRVGHDLAIEQQQQSVDDQYKFYICEDVYKISLMVIYTFSCREPIFFCLDTFTLCVCVYIYTHRYIYTHTHIYIYIYIYTRQTFWPSINTFSPMCLSWKYYFKKYSFWSANFWQGNLEYSMEKTVFSINGSGKIGNSHVKMKLDSYIIPSQKETEMY